MFSVLFSYVHILSTNRPSTLAVSTFTVRVSIRGNLGATHPHQGTKNDEQEQTCDESLRCPFVGSSAKPRCERGTATPQTTAAAAEDRRVAQCRANTPIATGMRTKAKNTPTMPRTNGTATPAARMHAAIPTPSALTSRSFLQARTNRARPIASTPIATQTAIGSVCPARSSWPCSCPYGLRRAQSAATTRARVISLRSLLRCLRNVVCR